VDTIFEAFATKGFGLSALIPASIYPELVTATDLKANIAQMVLTKRDYAVANSLVGEKVVRDQSLTTTKTAVPKNKMLPYLIGVFALLITILIVLLVRR
jgi:hypothetical protein